MSQTLDQKALGRVLNSIPKGRKMFAAACVMAGGMTRDEAVDLIGWIAETYRAALPPPEGDAGELVVTDAMVEAAEAAVYPRHERGFLSKPLVDAIDMRAALNAALRSSVKIVATGTPSLQGNGK